jgi:hypothetical protein
MYLERLYDPEARSRRIRYAIANILRDRVVNEGAFKVCFEMDDDEVIRAILRRGLKSPRLYAALQGSHVINLAHWLARYPDLAEAYYSLGSNLPEDHRCG